MVKKAKSIYNMNLKRKKKKKEDYPYLLVFEYYRY